MSFFAPDMFGPQHFAPEYWSGIVDRVDPNPCDLIVAGGGAGIGPDALGTNFPFVEPSADVRHLLADAWLSHRIRDAARPLSIAWLYGFDAAFCYDGGSSSSEGSSDGYSASRPVVHAAEIEIRDGDGDVVFDSTEAFYYTARNFGTRLRIHEWRTTEATCRVVQHIGFDDADEVVVFPREIEPEDGRLDERCSYILPDRIEHIGVENSPVQLIADGELVAGYNVALTARPFARGLRRGYQVIVDAEAGGGPLGRFPGCEEPVLYVRKIAGRPPDSRGNFLLAADDCYFVRRPSLADPDGTAEVGTASLVFGNDCSPCCDCEDYEEVQKGILATWLRYEELEADRAVVDATLRANIARWVDDKACREAQPIKLNLLGHSGRYAEVAVGVCNSTDECLEEVRVRLSFNAGTIVAGSTFRSTYSGTNRYDMAPAGVRTFDAYHDMIPTHGMGVVRFRVDLTEPGLFSLTAQAFKAGVAMADPRTSSVAVVF